MKTEMTRESSTALLGVAYGTQAGDLLRAAYRVNAKRSHPDNGGSALEFDQITQAYDYLCSHAYTPTPGFERPTTQSNTQTGQPTTYATSTAHTYERKVSNLRPGKSPNSYEEASLFSRLIGSGKIRALFTIKTKADLALIAFGSIIVLLSFIARITGFTYNLLSVEIGDPLFYGGPDGFMGTDTLLSVMYGPVGVVICSVLGGWLITRPLAMRMRRSAINRIEFTLLCVFLLSLAFAAEVLLINTIAQWVVLASVLYVLYLRGRPISRKI